MSSSKNKSNSTGLRILWIPGLKRQNRKGRYDCTNKKVTYTAKQKPNEAWSLGGSKAQKDILKADFDSEVGPSTSASILPISCAVGAETAGIMKSDEIETSTPINKKANDETIASVNSLKCVIDDVEHHQYHEPSKLDGEDGDADGANYASTMPLRHKHRNHSNNQGDLNSIESVTEGNTSHSTQEADSIDGSMYHIANRKLERNKEKFEENDICVKCLYYTCMCCECRIS